MKCTTGDAFVATVFVLAMLAAVLFCVHALLIAGGHDNGQTTDCPVPANAPAARAKDAP